MFIVCLIIYALFFLMCFLGTGGDKKNIMSFYTYPDEVQALIRRDAALCDMIPKQSSRLVSFISNTILFSVVFIIAGRNSRLCLFSIINGTGCVLD